MTGVLKFPKLGSEKTVPLYDEPVRAEGETGEAHQARLDEWQRFKAVTLSVRLVSRESSRAWSMRWEAIAARDKKRISEAEKGGASITQEAVQELIKLQRDILKASLVSVSGIQYGETLAETVTDSTALVELLDGCGLLSAAALAASRAQAPTPQQGES